MLQTVTKYENMMIWPIIMIGKKTDGDNSDKFQCIIQEITWKER
jgi:hypothetical protein